MTPRERRTALLGAGIAALAFLLLRVMPATVRAYRAQETELKGQQELLSETESAIAGLTGLEDSAKALKQRVGHLGDEILTGQTEPEAVADLQGRFGLLAGRHRISVSSVRAVPDTVRAGALRRVTAAMAFETDTEGLAAILTDLGRTRTLIVPERLRITATDPSSAAGPEVLQVELLLSGWYLPQRGS